MKDRQRPNQVVQRRLGVAEVEVVHVGPAQPDLGARAGSPASAWPAGGAPGRARGRPAIARATPRLARTSACRSLSPASGRTEVPTRARLSTRLFVQQSRQTMALVWWATESTKVRPWMRSGDCQALRLVRVGDGEARADRPHPSPPAPLPASHPSLTRGTRTTFRYAVISHSSERGWSMTPTLKRRLSSSAPNGARPTADDPQSAWPTCGLGQQATQPTTGCSTTPARLGVRRRRGPSPRGLRGSGNQEQFFDGEGTVLNADRRCAGSVDLRIVRIVPPVSRRRRGRRRAGSHPGRRPSSWTSRASSPRPHRARDSRR